MTIGWSHSQSEAIFPRSMTSVGMKGDNLSILTPVSVASQVRRFIWENLIHRIHLLIKDDCCMLKLPNWICCPFLFGWVYWKYIFCIPLLSNISLNRGDSCLISNYGHRKFVAFPVKMCWMSAFYQRPRTIFYWLIAFLSYFAQGCVMCWQQLSKKCQR